MSSSETKFARPRRGRPPLVSRAKIIAAARTMDPDTITMQAVADKLGVDRKTLRYHVSDRDGLMTLLAADMFQTAFEATDVVDHDDWRDAVRAFASATRDGILAMGGLAGYANFRSDSSAEALAPAETMLEALTTAGFDVETAARSLQFVSEFVFTSGRNALAKSAAGQHPQTGELKTALSQNDSAPLSALRQIMDGEDDFFDDRQFEFDLRLLIVGMERLLEQAPPRP